jgi:outer membrane protein TolC
MKKRIGFLSLSLSLSLSLAGAAQAQTTTALTPAPPPGTPPSDPLAGLLATGRGLTSDEVARRAMETSVEGRVKDRALDVAVEKREEAKAGYLPKLTGTARYTRLSHLDPTTLGDPRFQLVGTMEPGAPLSSVDYTKLKVAPAFSFPVPENNYVFQATLTIPLSDYVFRVSNAIAAATHSERAASIDTQAARLHTGAEARVAYYQWVRARGQALVATQSLEQARGHLRDAQQMFTAGLVSQADTLRAESQVKQMELLVTRTQSFVALAEEQLRVDMHDAGPGKYEVGEDIIAPLPPLAEGNDLGKLQAQAFDRRLELRALDETEGSVLAMAKVARAARYPRLDLQGNATYANPNPRIFPAEKQFRGTWDASVILSWTPTDILGAHHSERGQKAQAAQVAAQRDQLIDGVRMEVANAWRAAREAEVAMNTTLQGLRAAEEGYRVRDNLFRNGKATLVELNDSQSDLVRAKLEIVNAHIDARVARVQLNHAIGGDVGAVPPL